jgi:hypothetical protein
MNKSSGFVTAFIAAGVYALVFAAPLIAEDIFGRVGDATVSVPAVLGTAPLGTFSARWTGSMTLALPPCATVTCNSGDTCNCVQATIPVNPTGLGKGTLTMSMNN